MIFFLKKTREAFNAKASDILQQNIGLFQILTFEILTKRLLITSLVLNNRGPLV